MSQDQPYATPTRRQLPGGAKEPMHIDQAFITTALELPGYRITMNHGVVRGIVVRSRSIVGNFFAGLQTIVGGNITLYANLCERARN
jgi:hypothetical protein